jgi:hypothetical protein
MLSAIEASKSEILQVAASFDSKAPAKASGLLGWPCWLSHAMQQRSSAAA